MLFRHILAAYDGSVQAKRALEKSVQMVDSCSGTKLTVIHAVNLYPLAAGDIMIAPTDAMSESALKRGEELLEEARLYTEGLCRVNTEMIHGSPSKVIIQQAAERGCDLIVVGSRGLGPIQGAMLGSVSRYVVQYAKVPVLVIK
ncbi:universal stress protein [Paenibacillus sambharensis]|nr:universal stress protein [Paenibacillus sambharensis]